MSKNSRKSDRVLSVAATARTVHAVLLETGPDGPEVVRKFSRQRAVATGAYEATVPKPAGKKEAAMGGGDDFTIEFGDGSSSDNNLFMSSEFGAIQNDGEEGNADVSQAASFEFELGDIISEAGDAGYDDAVLAFTLSPADATLVEIKVESKNKPDRNTLLDALTMQHKGTFDDERVVFVPMTQLKEGERRYLAVSPKRIDSVSKSISTLREGNDRLPPVDLVDAEVTTLLGLARAAKDSFGFHGDADPDEFVQIYDDEGEEAASAKEAKNEKEGKKEKAVNTLVVRAGAEDTLVLFMSGNTLHHCEILRSLTTFDQAETICSRVLLQQDEHGISEVEHVLVLSEEREDDLADSFEVFFPDSKVERLRSYLPSFDETDTEDAATSIVSATAAALRALDDPSYAPLFEDVNFLPKKLAKQPIKLPLNWNVVAMSVAIVLTTLFFMAKYTTAESEISSYREELRDVAPEEVTADISDLQARIDSMDHLYKTYTRAIEVLDTLLIGSDRWSRVLENTSKEASNVRGLWIESFQQQGPNIQLSGNATSREQVVLFASRINGTIESLVFSEIREAPVYTYSMAIPVSDSLPEAARYLRDNVRFKDGVPVSDDTNSKNAADNRQTAEATS